MIGRSARIWRLAGLLAACVLTACTTTVVHQATVQERSPVLASPPRAVAPATPVRPADRHATASAAPGDKPSASAPSAPSSTPAQTPGARTGTEDPVAVATPMRSEAAPSANPSVASSAPPAVVASTGHPAAAAANPAPAALQWGWPVEAPVSQAFTDALKGVDFAAPLGTPVRAAASGTVSFVGSSLRGYGRMVVLKHEQGYLSVYAHNRQVRVKEGERVNRGQVIAEMGNSDSEAVLLHFEVRHLGKPVDPVQVLPARNAGAH